jgi:HEAT repeat protein
MMCVRLHWRQSSSLQLLVSLSALLQCASHVFEAECRPQMAGAVQLVVELLKDDYSNVRQAAWEAIPKLADVCQSVSSPYICISNAPQVDCHDEIAKAIEIIVEQFKDKDWQMRQTALKAFAALASVC